MNIFSRLAARTLKVNYARTIVSLCGIVLSSLLLTAIFSSAETLSNLLVTSTISTSGSWQVAYQNVTKQDVDDALSDKRVSASAEIERYGYALADSGDEGDEYFTYFSLSSMPKQAKSEDVAPQISLVEGRLPNNSHEIIIPESIRGYTYDEGFESDGFQQSNSFMVGTTIGMALGARQLSMDGEKSLLDESYSVQIDDRGNVAEELVDVSPMRDFIIVGIYSVEGSQNEFWDSPAAYPFITFDDDGIDPIYSTLYVRADGLDNHKDIERLAQRFDNIDDAVGATLHNNLLTYQGLTRDTPASVAFWSIAYLLSAIVLAASITLTYNSFAISISERARQYGLLSSIGASRRQLRVAVFTEAAMLALIGIPVGILLGMASTRAAFELSHDGLIALLYGNGAIESADAAISVSISGGIVLGIAIVEALTLLLSTAIPAVRASKVSAVDALRMPRDPDGIKKDRRHETAKGCATPLMALSRWLDSAYLAFGGVPHLLARRSLKRPNSKGRIAVASLAISVALLVFSGALVQYLEKMVDIVGTNDVDVTTYLDRDIQEEETISSLIADSESVAKRLEKASGANLLGYSSLIASYGSLAAGAYNEHALDSVYSETELSDESGPTVVDGKYYGLINLEFVDDASWRSYIDELGLDQDEYCDADHPRGIAYNGVTHQWDGKRYMVRSFSDIGDATLYTCIEALDNTSPAGVKVGLDGRPEIEYYRYDESASTIQRPIDKAVQDTYDLPIGAIADTAPACAADLSVLYPVIILPVSALETISNAAEPAVNRARAEEQLQGLSTHSRWSENNPFSFFPVDGSENVYKPPLSTTYSFSADNPRQAADNLKRELNSLLNNRAVYPYGTAVDATESTRTQRAIILAVKIFTGCFAGITTLIAVANVFNTISTSLVLRRREFAVLRSMGMDNMMFRKMIIRECASYAVRGLACGMLLAFCAISLIFNIAGGVFIDVAFAMPLRWIGLSAVLVLFVLTLSTIYALRKCDRGSIVESLRDDLA